MTTLLRISLGLVWIATGALVVFPAYRDIGNRYLDMLGLGEWVMWTTCLLEIGLGFRVAFGPATRGICALQVAIIVSFTVCLAWLDPALVVSPFGMLSKNVSLIVAIIYLWPLAGHRSGSGDLGLLRIGMAFPWVYDGILPKILFVASAELEVVEQSRFAFLSADVLLMALGVLQAVSGLAALLLSGRVRQFVLWSQLVGLVLLPLLVSESRPDLWLHPFGPFTKNLPIIAGTWLLIRRER